ncbi:CTP synthase 1 [Salpingoeca rosetta]|uniref:CTP synthase n=1 Tax=Salpingoeca rosetta (strain ATCC 50818 / BSB-021) TaxID=946362 RepID=F2U9N8_SALR5|nr:CTP synthase 1 [Salpingoeca rosetta]EGD73065.1 CTP synthase 1 [Salpingoeca rosetta]|eukprot:XP_004994096.1 CTP synthase 1 [Salpingoeca rosetta]
MSSSPKTTQGKQMKYILVTGGVISGIGKGIISSSLGTIIKGYGLRPTSIKIDPYLNIDAGTFSPYEHGEVYVLDDGGEVDLDLGNYERFLDVTLCRDNNITTGKVYQNVIQKERRGDYLGKTVQVVPHVTDEIQNWVERVAARPNSDGESADVCIIELGGTIGDIESMPFVEAFRQFQFRVGSDNFLLVHVSLIPQPSTTGEQKSKPTQHSVRELRGLGLSPDFIVCRSKNPLQEGISKKIAMFCHVPENQVVAVPDVDSIYRVPLVLLEQGLMDCMWEKFKLPPPQIDEPLRKWRWLADRCKFVREKVRIVLVGKYTGLGDAYLSVIKSLQHSCVYAGRQLDLEFVEASALEEDVLHKDPVAFHRAWQTLCSAEGILVPGGFGSRGIEGKIAAVNWARTKEIPYLGICLGLQVAVIEFCRNVIGWKDANTTEIAPTCEHKVVIDMPEHTPEQMGGTMRLGRRRTVFVKPDCLTRKLYNNVDYVEERHRHRYEVNPDLVEEIEGHGLRFVGHDVDGKRMEILELPDHPFFVAVQYHPEFLSRPLRPSPPFLGFVLAASGILDAYLAGNRISPEYLESQSAMSSPGSVAAEKHLARTPLASLDASTAALSLSPVPTAPNGTAHAADAAKDCKDTKPSHTTI